MAFTRDSEFARNFQENEIATAAYEAAQNPFSRTIIGNPDAALALQLQRMEVETPLPPTSFDEESERIALQLQEQEDFEREQHDAAVAQRLADEEQSGRGHNSGNRVSRLNDALENMQRNRPSPNNEMNFSRSVRGPSMMQIPDLSVFGPGNVTDHFPDDLELDGLNTEETILPRPRQRQQNRRFSGYRGFPVQDQPRRPENQHILHPEQRRPNERQANEIPHLPNIQQEGMRNEQDRLQVDHGQLPGHNRARDLLRPRGSRGNNPLLPVYEREQRRPGIGGRFVNILTERGRNHRNDDIDLDDYEALWELQERNGDVGSKGLTPQQIGRIPYHKFKSKPGLNVSGTSDKNCCRICLCDYNDGEKVKTLPCFHSYHKDCIDKWLKSQAVCPVCRENIKTN